MFVLFMSIFLTFAYPDVSISEQNLDDLTYQDLVSQGEISEDDSFIDVSGGDLSFSHPFDNSSDLSLFSSDFSSDDFVSSINLSIGTNILDIFDRVVSGSSYKYYYCYSVYGSPQQYFLYLSNDLNDNVLSSGLLLSYTYNSGPSSQARYYLNRSSFSSFVCPLGSDLCYTNIVPDYPILGDLSYYDSSPFFVPDYFNVVFPVVLFIAFILFIFKLFAKGR